MNTYIIIRNFATICLLGIMMGFLLPIPVLVWRVLFVLLCGYSVLIRFNYLSKIETSILLVSIMCFIHFVVSFLWTKSPSTSLIGAILFTMPSCLLFHHLSIKGVITDKWINICCLLFLVGAIFNYYHYYGMFTSDFVLDEDEFDSITNNTSTLFVSLITFVLLSKNRIIQWISILTCWFFLLNSAKRGNILAASLPTILFLIPYLKESRKSFWKMVLFITSTAIAFIIGYKWYMNSAYLLEKINRAYTGDSSGRDIIYLYYLNYWSLSSFSQLVFGHGFNGTIHNGGLITSHAHNDWIESLVDYGLVGFFLLFLVFRNVWKLIIHKRKKRIILLSVFWIMLIKSMISMGYVDPLNVFEYITLGILLPTDTLPRSLSLKNSFCMLQQKVALYK